MGNALQMASIHTELRPTGALLTHRGALTPDTPPPYWRVHGALRIGPERIFMPVRDM
jgi:hypothetical protein